MSEFKEVATVQDLNNLDEKEMVAGYLAGINNDSQPGSDKSRAYWHGWKNGMCDKGRMVPTDIHRGLVMQIVGKFKNLH